MTDSQKVESMVGTKGQSELEALKAQIAALTARNQQLESANSGPITCKLGKRGGVSVYGLQRQPITLYAGQWTRFAAFLGAKDSNPVSAFIASKPTRTFSIADDFKEESDKKFLAEIRQGKHPHATITPDGETVKVVLAEKAAS
jgi:hypothetical protein